MTPEVESVAVFSPAAPSAISVTLPVAVVPAAERVGPEFLTPRKSLFVRSCRPTSLIANSGVPALPLMSA